MGAKTATRLVILIMTVLVVSVSIFFIQRYQVSRINQSVLQGRKAEAEAEAEREKAGKFEEAVRLYQEHLEVAIRLYQEHLEVAPDDEDAQLKYADVLLKGAKNPSRQELAAQIYERLLARSLGRDGHPSSAGRCEI